MRTPNRPSPMPDRHPHIAHFDPYLFGDSLRAIRLAKRLGYRYIDQNGQVDRDGETWVVHWWRFRKEWNWMWTGEYNRLGIEKRVRVGYKSATIGGLSSRKVERLRSARFGGRRPRRLVAHMQRAADVGIILCWEVKNARAFCDKTIAQRVRAQAIRTGVVMVVMTLQNLPDNAAAFCRLKNFAEEGFAVALLPRGPKPADWDGRWADIGCKQWGRWR